MPSQRFVIIGSSAAGTKAAETIRRLQPNARITLVTEEEMPFYSRCLLPDYLAGEKTESSLLFRPVDFVQNFSLELITNERVISIDPKREELKTAKGRTIGFDKLLVSTGSSYIMPPVPGLKGEGILGLRSINDAQKILKKIQNVRRVTVVGAGFVGLEVAYALYRQGKEVTVIEKYPRVLPQQLDEIAADLIRKDLQAEGIRLLLGSGLKEVKQHRLWYPFLRGRQQMEIILENDDRLKTDLIIVAVGTRPNTELLEGSGVSINVGIPVNNYMETNIENIYAAGDVAEALDVVTGKKGLTPIWPNAVVQGRVAGMNMAGRVQPYSAQIAMQNAVEFREVPAIALGMTNPPEVEGYQIYAFHQFPNNIYRKLVLYKDIPKGMILVGDIKQAGVMASLIRREKPLTEMLIKRFLYGNLHLGNFLSNKNLSAV